MNEARIFRERYGDWPLDEDAVEELQRATGCDPDEAKGAILDAVRDDEIRFRLRAGGRSLDARGRSSTTPPTASPGVTHEWPDLHHLQGGSRTSPLARSALPPEPRDHRPEALPLSHERLMAWKRSRLSLWRCSSWSRSIRRVCGRLKQASEGRYARSPARPGDGGLRGTPERDILSGRHGDDMLQDFCEVEKRPA